MNLGLEDEREMITQDLHQELAQVFGTPVAVLAQAPVAGDGLVGDKFPQGFLQGAVLAAAI